MSKFDYSKVPMDNAGEALKSRSGEDMHLKGKRGKHKRGKKHRGKKGRK